jgi:hypothetical protein
MLEFLCPHCNERVRVAEDRCGGIVTCNACGGSMAVPALALPVAQVEASKGAPAPPNQPSVAESLGKAGDSLKQAGDAAQGCGCTAMLLGIGLLLILAALVYVTTL